MAGLIPGLGLDRLRGRIPPAQTVQADPPEECTMSNVSTPTVSITVADLDAARQAATDCIEAAVIVREALHATDYPLPLVLPEQPPPPEVHETIAMLLEGLNRAITGEPLIAKVEPYFTKLGAAELPGVGIEANWHRLALRFAMLARGAIVNGIREAAAEQMMQSAGELLAARERIWASRPKTLNRKMAVLPVPKELKARAKADAERCERCVISERGQPPRHAQTADEIAAVVVPRTWRVIRKKIGDPMEIDLGVLSAGVNGEYTHARRWACTVAQNGGHEDDGLRPRWDDVNRTLHWRGSPIKTYKRGAAERQTTILDAFEKYNWPSVIADPFNDPTRLSQTIRDMSLPLGTILFSADGDRGVRWDPAPPR